MSDKDDGGSAFPQVETEYNQDSHEYTGNVYSCGGMTLRDYFAGQALANHRICESAIDDEKNAAWAYNAADAMLKERAQ